VAKALEVEIYGQRYVLKGDADEAYVKRLAAFVDGQIRHLAQGTHTTTLAKLAVLAAINISHQLFQVEAERRQEAQDVERRAAMLMESIEEQLQSESAR